MTYYRHPDERASETVTFRLTLKERRLLDAVAAREQKTLTDLIRHLLTVRADELGVSELDGAERGPSPGRARKRTSVAKSETGTLTASSGEEMSSPAQESATDTPPPTANEESAAGSRIRDLVERFREHFKGRAEGTRRELDETIEFLTTNQEGEVLLPMETPLGELSSTRLKEIRDDMMKVDLRVAKKNLHLTYLRMMLHFAVKHRDIDLDINPALDLRPFTLSEIPEAWPGLGYKRSPLDPES